mmetsp:Transcript_34988/g.109820  ORF Transcript_34988/g.109820 Transcript_34988/m.109820 type:complete len:223 (+) Transcript_34988:329-997(+)
MSDRSAASARGSEGHAEDQVVRLTISVSLCLLTVKALRCAPLRPHERLERARQPAALVHLCSSLQPLPLLPDCQVVLLRPLSQCVSTHSCPARVGERHKHKLGEHVPQEKLVAAASGFGAAEIAVGCEGLHQRHARATARHQIGRFAVLLAVQQQEARPLLEKDLCVSRLLLCATKETRPLMHLGNALFAGSSFIENRRSSTGWWQRDISLEQRPGRQVSCK